MFDFIASAFAETASNVLAPGITFNWEINVGQIIGWVVTVVVFASGGVWWMSKFHADVGSLRSEISSIRETLNALNNVLITLAQHNEKFANTDRRLARLENQYDELRRGIGYIQK